MVLGGVTLGMCLMTGRRAVGSEEPVAVTALPGGAYFGGVGTSTCCDQADHRPQKPAQCTSKTKEFTGLVSQFYGVRAQVYIFL